MVPVMYESATFGRHGDVSKIRHYGSSMDLTLTITSTITSTQLVTSTLRHPAHPVGVRGINSCIFTASIERNNHCGHEQTTTHTVDKLCTKVHRKIKQGHCRQCNAKRTAEHTVAPMNFSVIYDRTVRCGREVRIDQKWWHGEYYENFPKRDNQQAAGLSAVPSCHDAPKYLEYSIPEGQHCIAFNS